ncbi:hypothetical protein [Pseudoflavonifractor phocaeensis]|uniref:hypothetical protein n=1 Tax=Pseudoflavonifractor phocaeensis TaxID=1870988 RepID=UPI0021097889|nr:hypothetical protein [Pseudoflavonifractor phocaeensis]MCQ4863443.1 hypothetical protein [Pseudoflavonifractor phocaeensis]
MKKVIILAIASVITIGLVWPVGLVLIVLTIVFGIIELKNGNTLETKVNLIAKQLGIEYGTPEEKLIQIASIAAKGQEQGRE